MQIQLPLTISIWSTGALLNWSMKCRVKRSADILPTNNVINIFYDPKIPYGALVTPAAVDGGHGDRHQSAFDWDVSYLMVITRQVTLIHCPIRL